MDIERVPEGGLLTPACVRWVPTPNDWPSAKSNARTAPAALLPRGAAVVAAERRGRQIGHCRRAGWKLGTRRTANGGRHGPAPSPATRPLGPPRSHPPAARHGGLFFLLFFLLLVVAVLANRLAYLLSDNLGAVGPRPLTRAIPAAAPVDRTVASDTLTRRRRGSRVGPRGPLLGGRRFSLVFAPRRARVRRTQLPLSEPPCDGARRSETGRPRRGDDAVTLRAPRGSASEQSPSTTAWSAPVGGCWRRFGCGACMRCPSLPAAHLGRGRPNRSAVCETPPS